MKRLVLSLFIIGLLSSSGYAKQIAYCQSHGLTTDYIESCWKYTNKGSNSIKNIKTYRWNVLTRMETCNRINTCLGKN